MTSALVEVCIHWKACFSIRSWSVAIPSKHHRSLSKLSLIKMKFEAEKMSPSKTTVSVIFENYRFWLPNLKSLSKSIFVFRGQWILSPSLFRGFLDALQANNTWKKNTCLACLPYWPSCGEHIHITISMSEVFCCKLRWHVWTSAICRCTKRTWKDFHEPCQITGGYKYITQSWRFYFATLALEVKTYSQYFFHSIISHVGYASQQLVYFLPC